MHLASDELDQAACELEKLLAVDCVVDDLDLGVDVASVSVRGASNDDI